jgi:hypothetical protein
LTRCTTPPNDEDECFFGCCCCDVLATVYKIKREVWCTM